MTALIASGFAWAAWGGDELLVSGIRLLVGKEQRGEPDLGLCEGGIHDHDLPEPIERAGVIACGFLAHGQRVHGAGFARFFGLGVERPRLDLIRVVASDSGLADGTPSRAT